MIRHKAVSRGGSGDCRDDRDCAGTWKCGDGSGAGGGKSGGLKASGNKRRLAEPDGNVFCPGKAHRKGKIWQALYIYVRHPSEI